MYSLATNEDLTNGEEWKHKYVRKLHKFTLCNFLKFIYRKPETSVKWRIGLTRILLYVLSTNAQGLYYRSVISHLQSPFDSYSIYVYLVVGRLFSQNYMACSIPSRIIEASISIAVWGEYSTLETHRDCKTGVIHVAMPCLMDPYRIVCIIILKACRGY